MTDADAGRLRGASPAAAPPSPPPGAALPDPAVAGGADWAAGLPQPLADLVRETVGRTRLRRHERTAVAAELAAHLRDGLAAGRSADALAAEFGAPRAVAPLIRRATVAKRGFVDRTLHRVLKWGSLAAAGVVGLYLLAALRLWWLAPTIRFDPVERLNAMLPDASGAPAWPRYKDALRWHREAGRERAAWATLDSATPEQRALARSEPGALLLAEGDARPLGPLAGPSDTPAPDPALARAADVALLRAHQKEIAALRDAAALPVLGYPMGMSLRPEDASYFGVSDPATAGALAADFPALNILLPQIAELRRAARLLAADAWLAIEEGDGHRAAADLAAILGVANHVEENRTLVGQLVGTAIRAMASQHIRGAVARRPAVFGEADLALLAAALAAVPTSAYEVDTSVERLGFEDSVQRLYSDDGDGDGVLLIRAVERLEQLTSTFGTVVAAPAPVPPARPGSPVSTPTPPPTPPPPQSSGSQVLATSGEAGSALAFLAGPAAAVVDPGRRATLDSHARLMDAIERESRLAPWDPKSGEAVWQIEQELFGGRGSLGGTGLPPPGQTSIVLRILAPAISKAAFERRMSRWWIESAQVAVALERYRQARGEWPSTLDALVPTLLDAVPRDPFDGQPLRYELRDGRPLVWSIGNDRVDDHGEPARDNAGAVDRDLAGRWRGPPKPVGFVDPRDGRFIERKGDGVGDWVMWDPAE